MSSVFVQPPHDSRMALLGAWGLGATDVPEALAAAGVLAGRWRQLKPELDDGHADLDAHLRAALTAVARGEAVPWRDPFTRAGWRRHEIGLDPSVLSAAWRDAVGAISRRVGQRPDESVRLRIHGRDATARPWSLPWMSTVLAQADGWVAAAVDRERRPGQVNWDWPLDVGLPPTPGGTRMLEHLDQLAEDPGEYWLARTTRRSVLGRRQLTASLLVLTGDPDEWFPWLTTTRPTVEVALALCDSAEQLDRAVATLLPQRGLRGVAGMLAVDPGDTVRWVLHGLTHDFALDTTVASNADSTHDARYVVHADPDALVQLRLGHRMRRASAQLSEAAHYAEGALEVMESDDGVGTAIPLGPEVPAAVWEASRRRPELLERAEDLAHRAESGDLLRELDGAVPLSEVTQATRELIEDVGPVRYVQARVHDVSGQAVRRLTAGVEHTVAVFVGPPEELAVTAPAPFPDERLEPDRTHRLTVVLTCPELEPAVQVATITLPPMGRSHDDARFIVRPPPGLERLEARIAILHGNRVLQSWLLTGPVIASDDDAAGSTDDDSDSQIALQMEALVRARTSDLHRRGEYDAAVIVNHGPDGRPGATFIRDDDAALVDLAGPDLKALLDEVLAELDVAVEDVEGYDSLDDEKMRRLLVLLANRGSSLRDAIVEQFRHSPDFPTVGARRLQVLSARAEAYLPLELLYDPPAPNPDAAVCPDGRAVLTADARDPCPAEHDRTVVCPLGFWGLNSVIERHTYSPGALDHGWAVSDEPTEGRDVIRLAGPVLVGASHRVDAVDADTVRRTVDRIATAAATTDVHNWQEWVETVAAHAPDLLIALPHTVSDHLLGPSLTIGIGDEEANPLGSAHISREHVRASDDGHTVVVLFGCETADPEIAFVQFPAAFRRARAQVVVGTLTRVVGRHAGPLAAELAVELLSSSPQDATTLGTALRELRRRHLDGFGPVVLALVAYGDADWIIEGAA